MRIPRDAVIGTCDRARDKIRNAQFLHPIDTLTVRLPDDLRDDLQKGSQEQNKPVSEIVRESIRRYVRHLFPIASACATVQKTLPLVPGCTVGLIRQLKDGMESLQNHVVLDRSPSYF